MDNEEKSNFLFYKIIFYADVTKQCIRLVTLSQKLNCRISGWSKKYNESSWGISYEEKQLHCLPYNGDE